MHAAAKWLLLPVGLVLGACSMPALDSLRAPDASVLFRRTSVTGLQEKALPPVTAADLVDAEGRCAAAVAGVETSGDPNEGQATAPASLPLIPAAIALDMTECEVVRRAGVPERVQIGTNERSERTAVLTYTRGERPGIYHFTSGRLTAMERAPEPPPASKPQRRPPREKPRAAAR